MLLEDSSDPLIYVSVKLTSNGTEVEYVDDTGTVQTVQGQQNSTPVCYKLERKEDSVLVYESDDGLNWVLVTTIVLSLVDLVNVGLVACASEEVQVVVEDIELETDASNEDVIAKASKVMGTEVIDGQYTGGGIKIKNGLYSSCSARAGCDYYGGIYRDALKSEAEVTLKVIDDKNPSYDDSFKPIGYKTQIEIPMSAINLDSDDYSVVIFAPSFPGEDERLLADAASEVVITFGNDVSYVGLRAHVLGGPILVHAADIRLAKNVTEAPLSGILKISVLPVDTSDFIIPGPTGSFDQLEQQFFALQSHSGLIVGENELATDQRYEGNLGIFKVPSESDPLSSCNSDVENPPSGSSDLAIPEGKTPLVLVHG